MTHKECDHHYDDDDRRPLLRALAGILAFILLILFIILLVWLILRPSKPQFILQDATLYAFDATHPNLLTLTLQITLSTRNPNDRIGIFYDRLNVHAAYHNQQITLPTALPPSYLGHKDVDVWSPFLYGNAVPVAPYLTASVAEDQNAGILRLNVKIDGRVKWKVGTWVSGVYHMWVTCPAFITFGNHNNGAVIGSGIKYQLASGCEVDI